MFAWRTPTDPDGRHARLRLPGARVPARQHGWIHPLGQGRHHPVRIVGGRRRTALAVWWDGGGAHGLPAVCPALELFTPRCGWPTGRSWGMPRLLLVLSPAARCMRPVSLWCRVPVLGEFGPGEPAALALVTGSVPIPLGKIASITAAPHPPPLSSPLSLIVERAVLNTSGQNPSQNNSPRALHAVNLYALRIDVGAEAHWVAVPVEADPQPIRAFPAHTASPHALAAWPTLCGITTVALESTGVYRIPPSELLETQGFGSSSLIRTMPKNGRPKTDVHDCQWLQRLHTLGLLLCRLRPDDPVVVLRAPSSSSPSWRMRPLHPAHAEGPDADESQTATRRQ